MSFLRNHRRWLGLGILWFLNGCATLPAYIPGKDVLSADEHFQLGRSYESEGDVSHAAEQYRLALKRDAHHAQALVHLGSLAFTAGDLKHAQANYTKALSLLPHDPAVSNNLAMVYLARGQHLRKIDSLLDDALKQDGLRPYALETK